jgi:hypothetical protein
MVYKLNQHFIFYLRLALTLTALLFLFFFFSVSGHVFLRVIPSFFALL